MRFFAYRFNVGAQTWTLCRTRTWTRIALVIETNGTKEIAMFTADRGTCGNRWPVVRLRAGCSTEITLLSREFFALTTHWHRCTVPCAVDECALCELLPSRGLFYCACVCQSRVSLLELGAMSSAHMEQHAKLLHGGMQPGQVFVLSRRGQKTPVHSEVERVQSGVSPIPLLSLAAHVLALYKFPPPNPSDSIEDYEVRIRLIAQKRNELAARQLTASKQTEV
jgi:hypothetical protein